MCDFFFTLQVTHKTLFHLPTYAPKKHVYPYVGVSFHEREASETNSHKLRIFHLTTQRWANGLLANWFASPSHTHKHTCILTHKKLPFTYAISAVPCRAVQPSYAFITHSFFLSFVLHFTYANCHLHPNCLLFVFGQIFALIWT